MRKANQQSLMRSKIKLFPWVREERESGLEILISASFEFTRSEFRPSKSYVDTVSKGGVSQEIWVEHCRSHSGILFLLGQQDAWL